MEGFTCIGVPIDSVGLSGGTELAPAALRELGLAQALGARDGGDLEVRIRGSVRDPDTGLLGSDDVLASTAAIRVAVGEAIGAGERPFLVGGCCAEVPGGLAGVRDALGTLPGLVNLDGHADLYDGETSPTGEAADMPVTVALGLGPAAWVDAAGGPSLAPDRLALVGYRDRQESVDAGMRQPESLPEPPLLAPLDRLRAGETDGQRIADRVGEAGPFWLHFDVDVLDQEVFPATDYLMPDGAGWEELGPALAAFLRSPRLIGASLGCYNPEKDPGLECGRRLVAELGAATG